MEKIHLKKHKRFLRILHILLRNNLQFFDLVEANGFMMDVRGKLSLTGNAKKRHYAFTVGSIGPTTKNHDLSFSQTTIRTTTGVLGVSMSLSY